MSEEPDPNPSLPILGYRTDGPEPTRRAHRIAQFANELQAQFVANILERADIPAFLFNTSGNSNSAVPGLVPVELHVRPEDVEQATGILADLAAGRVPIPEEDAEDNGGANPDEDPDPRCPQCRSWQVRPYQSLKEDLLRLFRLIPPLSPGVVKLECLRCGHSWVDLAQEKPRANFRAGLDVRSVNSDMAPKSPPD